MMFQILAIVFLVRYYGSSQSGRGMSLGAFFFFFGIPLAFALISAIVLYMQRNEFKLFKIFRYMQSVPSQYKTILYERFAYYARLSEKEQSRFAYRVNHFLINKKFIGEKNEEVDIEKKVLIAAATVQICFGLFPIYLAHFSKVMVYENDKKSLKEIGKKRAIIISWKEFEEGYSCANDGYNPGLQSIAVAVSIEHKLWGGPYGVLGRTPYRVWKEKSRRAAATMINTGLSKFKNVREVDDNEYFASAIVFFFEQPEVFYTKFPELYKAMKVLLRQDPRKGSKNN